MKNLYAEIIPALRLPKQFTTFDYILPSETLVKEGSIVFVSFRGKTVAGIVLVIKEKSNIKNLKPVLDILNIPPLPLDIIKTAIWMNKNLDVSLPLALKTILPDIPKRWKS